MKTFVLLLALALFAFPSAAVNAGKEQNDDVSFAGTWKTMAGELERTVILKQVGKTVTGSYTPGNGKIFDGFVTGNKLTFKWTEDLGKEGTAVFTMKEDGKGFTGAATALTDEFTFTWNTLNAPASFAGTWKTVAGGTYYYTVILKQVGKQVTGSYSPGNGKIFDGVVTGNKLTFEWTQDGGFEGAAVFTMNEDGKGFVGFSHAVKPTEFSVPWNTYEPEPTSFAGNWETISDGQYSIPLTIVQTGNKVTGLYPGNNGKIEGTVTGKVLRFKWESDLGSGSGRFVMDESNWAFSGTYNRGDNPDEVEATWNGTRPAGKGGKLSGNGTNAAVSFAGEWSSEKVRFMLKQTGDKVTGHMWASIGFDAPMEGKVVGNTLSFNLVRQGGGDLGGGKFVMASDGKSFGGIMNAVVVKATLTAPPKQ